MRAKVAKKTGPSLAAAKHLRALFESAAVRQKAHDARLELQKRIKDHNFAIQRHMDAHRLRDMTRGDTPLTGRVARGMVGPRDGTRPRSRTPPRARLRTRTPARSRTLTPPAPTRPPPTPARPQRFDLTPQPGPNAKRNRTRLPRPAMEVDGMRPRT